MGTTYGQFCPVAKAMELLDERWTLLVVRELLAGSTHFNELRRGVPKMSPALLSKRLRELERAGVVERRADDNRSTYLLTPAGRELEPVVEALGRWGVRWVPELGDRDLDPHLLLWDIHRNLDLGALPSARAVLQVSLTDVPGRASRWWIVATRENIELCDADPGHEVAVELVATLRDLTLLWRGDLSWPSAVESERVRLLGSGRACRAVQSMMKPTRFAQVPRPRREPESERQRRPVRSAT
jgi:DNA-binding HxlR family transcriptional regulator